MDAEIRVRRASPEDAGAIARVFVDSWRDSYAGLLPSSYLVRLNVRRQEMLWTSEIRRAGPKGAVIVACDDLYGVVGFASFGAARDKAVGYDGEVYTLYVDPNHMGRGAGRKLMAAAFARLFSAGFRSCVVWALKGNPARYFYMSEGGKLVAERPGAVGGRPVREVAFGWSDITPAAGARV